MKFAVDAILRPEQAAYLDSTVPPRDALLAEMEQRARDRGHPISDPEVAALLTVVTVARAPKVIVEVGTNIGYGAIVLARAGGADARVVTIENDLGLCEVAREFVARAGLADRVEVRHADALAALATFEGEIDLAYVDCVKEHYPAYLDLLVPKLSARGVLLADNVLWKGMVAPGNSGEPPASETGKVQALRTFNHAVVSDSRLRGVILPIGDGVAFAVRV